MPDSRSRRAVLRSGVAISSLAIAGCLDGSSDGDGGNTTGGNGSVGNTTDGGGTGENATDGDENDTDPESGEDDSDAESDEEESEETTVDSWPMHRYDAQNTGSVDVDPPTEDVEILWSMDIGAKILTNPVVDGETVYLRDAEGTVHAVEEGDVLWSESLGGDSTGLSPAIYEDLLLVPRAGGVSALDRSDGSEQWSYSTPAVPHELTVTGDAVVFADGGDGLYGLEAGSGEERWAREVITDGAGFIGAPVVDDDEAFIVEMVPAEDEYGQIDQVNVESGEMGFLPTGEIPLESGLTLNDDRIFAGGDGVFAFDLEGNKLWEFPTDDQVVATPVVANKKVFCFEQHSSKSTIHSIDSSNGEQYWSEMIGMYTPPAPIAIGDLIVFGDGGKLRLLAHETEDFSNKWEISGEFDTYRDPAYSNENIYFTSGRGKILSIGEP